MVDLGETKSAIRDNRWLEERLNLICSVHFADVAQGFPIESKPMQRPNTRPN